jgi:thiol-disulfide isomerase/thioredoxin
MNPARVGQQSPPLAVSEWVQGNGGTVADFLGQVILVEVFQVNCPGCFLYSLPQAIEFYQRYAEKGLIILGIATAFEDFELNTLENLRLLSTQGQVVGQTLRTLTEQGLLSNNCLPFTIPFPLGMDKLQPSVLPIGDDAITDYISERVPQFSDYPTEYQQRLRVQVRDYLEGIKYHAETFNRFNLQGTPSHILVDKHGILRRCTFGHDPELETAIQQLLAE